jgi:DNA polymerase-4
MMTATEIHPSLLVRKVIHFDMDAYYAAIEMRDDSTLRGKPVIVGGSPTSRGVVCTASYEARTFGVRSAMACATAARLCPQAIFVRPNFEKYRAVSEQIRAIFREYTSIIEPLSLDEAYLDVTNNERGLYAVKIAQMLQKQVLESTGLTGSAGVGPNKLIAKIASDIRKPAGLTVITPAQVAEFMLKLPLRKIHGIGPATEKRLNALGLTSCADVLKHSVEELRVMLGDRMAFWLHARSQGIDERPVVTARERKSIGKETTFAKDLIEPAEIRNELRDLAASLGSAVGRRSLRAKTVTLKVKYNDFSQVTRSLTVQSPVESTDDLFAIGSLLLEKTEAGVRKLRLLGLSLANFV